MKNIPFYISLNTQNNIKSPEKLVYVYLKNKNDELKENIENYLHKFPNGDLFTAKLNFIRFQILAYITFLILGTFANINESTDNTKVSYEIQFDKNYIEDELKTEIGKLFEDLINNYDEDVIEEFFKEFIIKLPNFEKISNKIEIILITKKYQQKIIDLLKNQNIDNSKNNLSNGDFLGKKRLNYIKNYNNNNNNNITNKDNLKIKTINQYFKPQQKLNNKIFSFKGVKNLIESKKKETSISNSNNNSISTSQSSSIIEKNNINKISPFNYSELYKKVNSLTNENSINDSNISTINTNKNFFNIKNSNQLLSFGQNSAMTTLSNFSEYSQYNGINSRLGNSNLIEKIKKSKSQKRKKKIKNSKLEKATSMLLKEGYFNLDNKILNNNKKNKEEEIKLKKTEEIKEVVSDRFYLDDIDNKEKKENVNTPIKKINTSFNFPKKDILAYKTPEKLSKKKNNSSLIEQENEEKKIKLNSYLLFSQLKSSI